MRAGYVPHVALHSNVLKGPRGRLAPWVARARCPGCHLSDASRLRTSASSRPATRTRLSRARAPWITATAEGATRRARARRRATARFASPSTGGAVTRTRRDPSRQPRIASLEARGWTRTLSTAPSGLLLAAVVPELGRYRPVVALERRAEVLDELALDAAEGMDLAPELPFLAPHPLEQLLAPQLGLAHVDLRLAPRRRLHLVAEPLRGDERVLERLLAFAETLRPLLERRELFLQEHVLPEHRLVVVCDVVEEGIHLVLVEAPDELHRELLLPDIQGADTHQDLRSLSQTQAKD